MELRNVDYAKISRLASDTKQLAISLAPITDLEIDIIQDVINGNVATGIMLKYQVLLIKKALFAYELLMAANAIDGIAQDLNSGANKTETFQYTEERIEKLKSLLNYHLEQDIDQ